ncbi:MAG TPA: HTTM domain-containing protein, partial [Archangium sp.]
MRTPWWRGARRVDADNATPTSSVVRVRTCSRLPQRRRLRTRSRPQPVEPCRFADYARPISERVQRLPHGVIITMSVLARLHAALARPVDGAGLAVFRILFGVLLAVGNLRFLLSGWPQKLYGEPTFFFRFAGFRHVPPLDVDSATWAYGGFVVCGVLIALGVLYRPAIVCFTVLFAWVQLADVTNYLNHYWLVLLLAACLCVLPATSCLALDNLLFRRRQRSVPRGAYLLLMFQVGVVYVFAAIAKIGPDWLLYGQPLGVWLPGRSELPVIGTLIAQPIVALLASWCGFLYDASIVPLLLWRRSRPFAYVLVVVFHTLTSLF